MNHGVQAGLYVRYRQFTGAVRFMYALVIRHTNSYANDKFANIVVWQREPLCAAVSRFKYLYNRFYPSRLNKTGFGGFLRKDLSP